MGFVADLFGAGKAAKAQKQAADKSAQASQYATDKTIAEQKRQFDLIWGETADSRKLGHTATGKLQGLMDGGDPTAWIESTPGYQANLKAGQRQLNASAASRGGLLSGDAAREALKYGADYATGVFNTERNALMAQAGLGQTALNTGAATGQNTTNAITNALQGNAQNLASSYQKKADATSGFWGTVSGTLGGNAFAKNLGSFASGFMGR